MKVIDNVVKITMREMMKTQHARRASILGLAGMYGALAVFGVAVMMPASESALAANGWEEDLKTGEATEASVQLSLGGGYT